MKLPGKLARVAPAVKTALQHWLPLSLPASLPLLLAAAPRPVRAAPAFSPLGMPDELGMVGAGVALLGGALCWRHLALIRRCTTLRLELDAERALRIGADQAARHATVRQRAALEAERRRIGRDIHDDLGQHLLALHLDIAGLRARLPATLQAQTDRIEEHIQLTIRSLRVVIRNLRPAALEDGLRLAMQRQLDDFSRVSGIRCHLDAAAGCTAEGAAEAALFRVLQETLSNVLRHAEATEVHVSLSRDTAGLTLVVRDNGIGLAPGCECRGHGLSGIADRVGAAGGRVTLDSQPGQGTAVRITLPAIAVCKEPEFCD